MHHVPLGRLRRPERDSARRRAALRIHRQAAQGLQETRADQRRGQHDQRGAHAERPGYRGSRALPRFASMTLSDQIGMATLRPCKSVSTRFPPGRRAPIITDMQPAEQIYRRAYAVDPKAAYEVMRAWHAYS